MHRTVAEEDTLLRPKHKFMSIILAKTRPACTSKRAERLTLYLQRLGQHAHPNVERLIVGMDTEEAMHRCVLLEDRCGHTVNNITCGKKSFISVV
jgi:hypothetical protein